MPNPTVYDFPQIYERLGMKLGHFGCIMLDVERIPVSEVIDNTWFYNSANPILKYVKGAVADKQAHCTLLYGLTPGDDAGLAQKESVDELLKGLDLSEVTIDSIGMFPAQFNEPYKCIVGHLATNNDLGEANRRLRFLPHIDTFVEYKPHVTLGYVKAEHADEAVSILSGDFEGLTVPAIGINYGGPLD